MQRLHRAALKATALALAVTGVLAFFAPRTTAIGNGYDVTYTVNAGFDQGTLFNVNHNAPNGNQLQLNTTLSTFPLMWVANSGDDTLSKIDTSLNAEVARYRTWYDIGLHDSWSGTAPSRTAVDIDGNAYVLNRHFWFGQPASVMKVLAKSYIDRNGNGVMDTATGTTPMAMGPDINGNGVPDSDSKNNVTGVPGADGQPDDGEIKDERIAWIKQVGNSGGLGRALCIGKDQNLWVGLYNQRAYYKMKSEDGTILAGPISVATGVWWEGNERGYPYGCVVDSSGTLWGANIHDHITELDTNAAAFVAHRVHGGNANYGITVGNGLVYTTDHDGSLAWRAYDPGTSTFASGPVAPASFRTGAITVSVDGAGKVYSGAWGGSTRKYDADGTLAWTAAPTTGTGDTRGTIIDSDGNIWRIHRDVSMVQKFRGSDGTLLATVPTGYLPYTYSDASGLTNLTNTTPSGTWTVIQDSGAAGTIWDTVKWNQEPEADIPSGAAITVRVRASDNQAALADLGWNPVGNGTAISGMTGRYIEVEVRLVANSGNESPVLSDVQIEGHPPNAPPDADAGEDSIVACAAANCQAEVTLDASGSDDPDSGDTLSYSWSWSGGSATGETATAVLPRGVHTITLTVTDQAGASDTDEVVVTAIDTTPPSVTAPESVVVSQTACSGTPVTLGPPSAADACGPVAIETSGVLGAYPIGTTTVTFTATDESGNTAEAFATVTVNDTTAPSIGSVTPNVTQLWPPNHRMVPVTVAWTMTDCDAGTTCSIVSVSSNEPPNANGDGNTEPDWQITGDNTVLLRAERMGPRSGRIYTITVRCVDTAGNESTSTATVTVPHDRR